MIYSIGLLLLGGQLMSIGFLAELFIAYHDAGPVTATRFPTARPRAARHAVRHHGPRFHSITPMTDTAADPRARSAASVYLLADLRRHWGHAGPHPGRRFRRSDRRRETGQASSRASWTKKRANCEQARASPADELDDALGRSEDRAGRAAAGLRRPFLSANDRSRWCTVRALVEPEMRVPGAPYAIDKVIDPKQPNWDTIDMVKHDGHFYSSKPPLLSTLMAAEYWLIYHVTGKSLGTHPYEIGRFMLITINGACLLLIFLFMARLVERLGTTDWGRIFVMAAACSARS